MKTKKERVLIDYINGDYIVKNHCGSSIHDTKNVRDLTCRILDCCCLGYDFKQYDHGRGKPRIELRFSLQARNSLDEKEIKLLRTIVDHYNTIVVAYQSFSGDNL